MNTSPEQVSSFFEISPEKGALMRSLQESFVAKKDEFLKLSESLESIKDFLRNPHNFSDELAQAKEKERVLVDEINSLRIVLRGEALRLIEAWDGLSNEERLYLRTHDDVDTFVEAAKQVLMQQ